MPTVTNVNLTLTTVDSTVTINVVYKAHFTPFERFLAGKGLKFIEHITVVGVDGAIGTVIVSFPDSDIPVTDGAAELILDRNRSRTVFRAQLQEDPAPGDNDEIRARITILPLGIPQKIDEVTPTKILFG